MSKRRLFVLAFLFAAVTIPVGVFTWAAEDKKVDAPKMPSPEDMAAMMEKAKKFTEPGEHHKLLEKFVGKWNAETRMFMGGQAMPPEKGTWETKWLIPGRWLQGEWKTQFMGRPFQSIVISGYDNFKQSYVHTQISNLDTAMTHAEGDLDPGGKVLITYGTLDEYLTGENDKMVKYVYRFESDDKIVMEVHDLPIGENNTKVFEVVMTRAK